MEEMIRGATAPETRSRWRRADPAYLVLALLPWLLVTANSGWLYNPFNSIDPWFYFGYFLDYPHYVADLFPNVYYGTRLPWILPGYLLYSLFNVVVAQYLLHFGFYYLAVFSLYGLLRRAVGPRNALLGAVLFGAHSYFLRAIGWDYVDGAGMTYNLLALLSAAQASDSRWPRFWLLLSGAAAAAMFYCNAFLVGFVLFPPALCLYRLQEGFNGRTVRLALRLLLWFAAGALLVTTILGIVNYCVGGNFWFYGPSIAFVRDASSKPSPYRVPTWDKFVVSAWLGFPIMMALGSVSYVLIGLRRHAFAMRDLKLFFVLQYLSCASLMIAWHMAGGVGLQVPFYTSYLLPSAFLALGCMLAFHLQNWTTLQYWLLAVFIAIAFAASLRLDTTSIAMHVVRFGWLRLAFCVGLCLILNNILQSRWQSLLLILSGLWLYQTGLYQSSLTGDQVGRTDLLRITDSLKLIREHTGDEPLRFWYNSHEPHGLEFQTISSVYLWSWAMISPDFPALLPAHPIEIGTTGVILSSQDDALQQANRALNSRHLEARSLGGGRIAQDHVSYQLLFFRVEAMGSGPEVPLNLSSTPGQPMQLVPSSAGDTPAFPKERWVLVGYPQSNEHLELRPDGVVITTHPSSYAYGAKYGPLTIVKTGDYRFVLNYQVSDGALAFGVVPPDGLQWKALSPSTGNKRGNGTRFVTLPLKMGERVFLVVTNGRENGPKRTSTFLIQSVRAFGFFGTDQQNILRLH